MYTGLDNSSLSIGREGDVLQITLVCELGCRIEDTNNLFCQRFASKN